MKRDDCSRFPRPLRPVHSACGPPWRASRVRNGDVAGKSDASDAARQAEWSGCTAWPLLRFLQWTGPAHTVSRACAAA